MLGSRPREKDTSTGLLRAGSMRPAARWDAKRLRAMVTALERNWALWAVLILLWIIVSAAIGSRS